MHLQCKKLSAGACTFFSIMHYCIFSSCHVMLQRRKMIKIKMIWRRRRRSPFTFRIYYYASYYRTLYTTQTMHSKKYVLVTKYELWCIFLLLINTSPVTKKMYLQCNALYHTTWIAPCIASHTRYPLCLYLLILM